MCNIDKLENKLVYIISTSTLTPLIMTLCCWLHCVVGVRICIQNLSQLQLWVRFSSFRERGAPFDVYIVYPSNYKYWLPILYIQTFMFGVFLWKLWFPPLIKVFLKYCCYTQNSIQIQNTYFNHQFWFIFDKLINPFVSNKGK